MWHNQVKDINVTIKTETFFMDSSEDAALFLDSLLADGFEAKLLPTEEQDGRVYYPVKVTFDTNQLKKKGE